MPQNLPKDTAGRTLIGFSVMVLVVVVISIQGWWKRTDLEWARLPTGIEDREYYKGDAGVGAEPTLRFWAAPRGLVRVREKPHSKPDSRMWKIPSPVDSGFPIGPGGYARVQGKPSSEGKAAEYSIYRYGKDELNEETGLPDRFFLKASDDRYVEFAIFQPREGGDSGLQEGGEAATPSAR